MQTCSQNLTHSLLVIMETLNLSTTGKMNCSQKPLLNFVKAQSNVNLRRGKVEDFTRLRPALAHC